MTTNKLITLLLITFLLLGCDITTPVETHVDPVAFESTDECHVCGMVILRQAGPKGQAFETRNNLMRRFCSTMEMMVWALQPENQANVSSIYVHDMASTPWDKPSDEYLIMADGAFYVLGSDLSASMGASLASFYSKAAAISFTEKHGGEIFPYESLSLNLLMTQIIQ